MYRRTVSWRNRLLGPWAERAACRGMDSELWYPPPLPPNAQRRRTAAAARAKEVCRDCPVREACLEHALTHDEVWGIWGGLLPEHRRRLRKENHGQS